MKLGNLGIGKQKIDTSYKKKEEIKYVVFECGFLNNEKIILLYDKKMLKEMRKIYPDCAIYFTPEIEELYNKKAGKNDIKKINQFKKEFGSWVVPNNVVE